MSQQADFIMVSVSGSCWVLVFSNGWWPGRLSLISPYTPNCFQWDEDSPQNEMFPLSLVFAYFFEDKTILSLVLILINFLKKLCLILKCETYYELLLVRCVRIRLRFVSSHLPYKRTSWAPIAEKLFFFSVELLLYMCQNQPGICI